MLERTRRLYEENLRLGVLADMRRRLKNDAYSLLSRNCIGGLLNHDLGQLHRSPTCDVYFVHLSQFVEFANNIEKYREMPIVSDGWNYVSDGESRYPKGLLGGAIELYFPHDKSIEEANAKWQRRFARFNLNRSCVLVYAGQNPSAESKELFQSIKIAHKCLYVSQGSTLEENEFPLNRGDFDKSEFDILSLDSTRGIFNFEELDCAEWLNSGKIQAYISPLHIKATALLYSLIGRKWQGDLV